MPENSYLSIGEVLGLLLEDFPDVTISKIRFLESQGLIEPERTPSGYRKFYDHDVDLLRAILHEQKANFLPLKVIRDRIESGAIEADVAAGRTPPRGIRNVETPVADTTGSIPRDSVFRRTDGGPEWVEGQALIPGETDRVTPAPPPITAAIPVVPAGPVIPPPPERATVVAALIEAPPSAPKPKRDASASVPAAEIVATPPREPPVHAPADTSSRPKKADNPAAVAPASASGGSVGAAGGMPYTRDELCAAAGISAGQLAQLEEFGIVAGRGTGRDITFQTDVVAVARVAATFLDHGIDARHLRAWRQSAERESTLYEQRIMPLLRQRNPQSRQQALDTLAELAELGGQLRSALMTSLLKQHFES